MAAGAVAEGLPVVLGHLTILVIALLVKALLVISVLVEFTLQLQAPVHYQDLSQW